tara:strand:- start:644 stop:886 length:243 start_codon:yes stop_codon:yes gene_type:complete
MDSKSNLYDTIIWNINLGDLVRIKKYNFEGSEVFSYGIVVSPPLECQIEMFPYVNVYNFDTREKQKCYPNSLEIVSHLSP